MSMWDQLAEARMREWLSRPQEERDPQAAPLDAALPLELPLIRDITELDRMAAGNPDDAVGMQKRATELMLRLMVLLENDGRPLAAQYFAKQRGASRSSAK